MLLFFNKYATFFNKYATFFNKYATFSLFISFYFISVPAEVPGVARGK